MVYTGTKDFVEVKKTFQSFSQCIFQKEFMVFFTKGSFFFWGSDDVSAAFKVCSFPIFLLPAHKLFRFKFVVKMDRQNYKLPLLPRQATAVTLRLPVITRAYWLGRIISRVIYKLHHHKRRDQGESKFVIDGSFQVIKWVTIWGIACVKNKNCSDDIYGWPLLKQRPPFNFQGI